MKKLLTKAALPLFGMPLVKGYMRGLWYSAIPILLVNLAVIGFVGMSKADLTQIDKQTAAAQTVNGRVPKAEVTARANNFNIVPAWVLVNVFLVLFGGGFLRKSLGAGTMLATNQLVEDARAAASGDFRVQPSRWFGNEYGDVQESFGKMIVNFRATVAEIERAAQDLKDASADMAHTSDEAGNAIGEVAQAISSISEGAAHQVDLILRSSGVVAEIEGSIRDTSEHARQAQQQSADTEKLSLEGVQCAAEVQEAMEAVRESSLQTSAVVRSLGEKSSDIDVIVRAITDIAAQTNMLALNASIEAARAGEQGKGFANVAEEVRVLAEDAQKAAEEIAALVKEIQSQTTQAVSAMEDGVMRVEEGFDTVNRNREAFHGISAAVRALHESSAEISELAEGIALGTGQVREQIEQVASVAEQSSASTEEVSASTQQTSAAAEEVSASAQRVAHTAVVLAELSSRFTLPGAEGDAPAEAA